MNTVSVVNGLFCACVVDFFVYVVQVYCLCCDFLFVLCMFLVQKEMDVFRETVWNSHRVRHQRDTQLPKGIPNHLYSFPEQYGAEDCGKYNVTSIQYRQKSLYDRCGGVLMSFILFFCYMNRFANNR